MKKRLILGKVYKFRDELKGIKRFSFNSITGIFDGYTKKMWPKFILGKGKTCFINATDDCFVEVIE